MGKKHIENPIVLLNPVIIRLLKLIPMLCPGVRSDGVFAGLSLGQDGLMIGLLSLTNL